MEPVRRAVPQISGIEDLVEVGRGGAGVVYRGRQTELVRDVAVKVVFSSGAPEEALRRWRREVTAMARLSNHPNIVAVYDGGVTEDGLPYLVMPFVPGGSLSDRLQVGPRLDAAEVVAVGTKLAGALAAAHEAGVLHRDVKPANVLLSPYEEPQLADFGIARLLDTGATTTGNVHATVTYAAPEVLSGQPASEASDVYSLGATLHACLTQTPPYAGRPGESIVSLALRVIADPPPDLRAAGVDAELIQVVEQAMAKEPADRIPTAAELARRLQRTVRSQPAGPAVLAPTMMAPRREPTEPAPASPVPTEAPTAAVPVGAAEPAGPVRRADRRWPIAAAVVVAVIGVIAALAILLTGDDGTGTRDAARDNPSTTDAPSDPTNTPAAEEPPPTTDGGDLAGTARAYIGALERGDVEGAYAMTTEGFRTAQPFEGFAEFWGGFDSITIEGEPAVDEAAATVTATLRLDGGTETYKLSFAREADGTLLVDGPRPR